MALRYKFHVKHSSFSNTEALENKIQHFVRSGLPGYLSDGMKRIAKVSGKKF
jgi:hypothetical protein